MRVLHVTDVYRPRIGGIEVFVEDLVRRQRDHHEVAVLTPTTGLADDPDVLRRPLVRALRTDLRGFDVVHAHLSVLSPYTTAVARRVVAAGVPLVLSVHSLWSGREAFVQPAGALAGWRRWPAVWTAVSEVAAADVRRLVGDDVRIVPNAVDVDWWRQAGHVSAPDPLTVVSVMRLAARKRPLALLDVLLRLREAVPEEVPLRAVLVGDGPLAGQVSRAALGAGMDWLELTGPLDRPAIRQRYASADVYVAPAHWESFGIAALEARAAGLPVVAMRSGGVGEFVRDGVEGLLCDDDDQLVVALAHLATAPATLAAMTAHNRAVSPDHGWDRVLAGFDDAYAEARCAVAAVPARRRLLVPRVRTGATSG